MSECQYDYDLYCKDGGFSDLPAAVLRQWYENGVVHYEPPCGVCAHPWDYEAYDVGRWLDGCLWPEVDVTCRTQRYITGDGRTCEVRA